MEQTEGLGDSAMYSTPTGMVKATVTQTGGLFDTAALAAHAAFVNSVPSTPQTSVRTLCFGFVTQAVGSAFWGFYGAFSSAYEAVITLAQLTKYNVNYVISGAIDRGVLVQPLAAKTANWNTHTLGTPVDFTLDPSQRAIPITSNSAANPSIVTCPVPHGLVTNQVVFISGVTGSIADINGQQIVTVIDAFTFSVPVNAGTHAGTGGSFVLASTVNGGAGYQQIEAFTGFTGFIGKIRSSADEAIYADLAVFANHASGQTEGQRVAVAGTIARYLCFDGAVTGSGSISLLSGFARNP
jgi:hypothetical protein